MPSVKKWLPLESNPDVISQFSWKMGLPASCSFCDVYGLDDEMLSMVTSPVLAVLLLFPVTEKSEEARNEEAERIAKGGEQVSPNVYFVKQTVGNACGTIALIHAVCNNSGHLALDESKFFAKFIAKTGALSPDERAKVLEDDTTLEEAHEAAAVQGDTQAPDSSEDVDLHFICFVTVDGGLYELDGRKRQAIYHGPSSPETLLKDSAGVIKQFVERTPDLLTFNVIAMTSED
eukprot:jgi/Mesvir1/19384/Mv10421-RA.1